MSYSIKQQIISISIPIPATFRQTALEFAQEQPTQSKAKQVYVNTLAVLVVNSYLEMLEIPTELKTSYSWNQYGRLMADVADLLLTGVGRLECRPIRTGDTNCYVPPDVWDHRIGYVVVELNKTCTEGKLRGFLPDIQTSQIDIEELQSLERLIESSHLVHLRQWLEGIYKSQWQSIEELSCKRTPQVAFRFKGVRGFQLDNSEEIWKVIQQLYPHRSWENNLPLEFLEKMSGNQVEDVESPHHNINSISVTDVLAQLLKTTEDEEKRWKLAETLWTIEPKHPAISARRIMDLGMQLANNPVGLMVAILSKPDKTVAVLLRVYPIGNQSYLPPGLQLAGLYENGEPFLEVKARVVDNYIQLKFCGEFGERFGVQVSVNNANITEHFII